MPVSAQTPPSSRPASPAPSAAPPPRLELRGICKRYPGVTANDAISLSIAPGEIHAVLGENGAGKSTLMKIIYGAAAADSGDILWNGRELGPHNPARARALGIEMVYQHFALFESVTVADNIALALAGRHDRAALSARIRALSQHYGLPVDPGRLVHHLSVGERQRVEIVRCLLQAPQLLILDEPTSVLTPQAAAALFVTLRQLASEGCSILYISHKLDEVQALCDSATVLRGGRVTGTARPRQSDAMELARMMVGSDLPQMRVTPATPSPQPRLEVRSLSAAPRDAFGTALRDVSLAVHGGEIVGIAGVSGNGQAELTALLSGERRHPRANAVTIDGTPCGRLDAGARRALGLAFVPEERLGRGTVPAHSLRQNMVLTAHRRGAVRHGFIDRARAGALARAVIGRFGVRANGVDAPAQSLSGGNLQKFIVGREIGLEPKVLLVAQPTWGVDVGAAAFIRQTLVDLSRAGTAVLVISEELDELFEICDRIAVMAGGQLSAPMPRTATSREAVGLMMTGQTGRSGDTAGERQE